MFRVEMIVKKFLDSVEGIYSVNFILRVSKSCFTHDFLLIIILVVVQPYTRLQNVDLVSCIILL